MRKCWPRNFSFCIYLSVNLSLKKNFFERQREFLSTDSLPRCLQWLGLKLGPQAGSQYLPPALPREWHEPSDLSRHCLHWQEAGVRSWTWEACTSTRVWDGGVLTARPRILLLFLGCALRTH